MIRNAQIENLMQMLEYCAKVDASPSEGLVEAVRAYIELLEAQPTINTLANEKHGEEKLEDWLPTTEYINDR